MTDEEKKAIEALVRAIHVVYHEPKHLIWRSFLVGLVSGLGATLGVAIIFTLLGFILRELGGLPGIGQYFLDVQSILPGR